MCNIQNVRLKLIWIPDYMAFVFLTMLYIYHPPPFLSVDYSWSSNNFLMPYLKKIIVMLGGIKPEIFCTKVINANHSAWADLKVYEFKIIFVWINVLKFFFFNFSFTVSFVKFLFRCCSNLSYFYVVFLLHIVNVDFNF